VPRAEIEAEGYDLSLSGYKEEVFAEVKYETPSVILEKLLKVEVGEVSDEDMAKVQSGIVRELLVLRGMIG
jgi:type I restriction enzyme M protein